MQWLFKHFIAHRGLHDKKICENSLNAFAKAAEKGYAIELDVQLSSDKKVLVFHDFNTFRLTNKDLEVQKTSYADLKVLSLSNNQDHIPSLKEVLTLIQGKVPLIIEIKNITFDGQIEEALAQLLDSYEGEYAVCSFNYKSLNWFKQNRAHMVRGLIFGEERKLNIKDFFNFIYSFDMAKPNFISLNYRHSESKIVRFCKIIKMPIILWTINTQDKEKKALKIANNIIFEDIQP